MRTQEAIMAFAQSEKVKSGIIWASQALELIRGLPEHEKQGSERTIKTIIHMISHEVRLARKIGQDPVWKEIERSIDQAMIMINSGVAPDSVTHLTQALSHVTGIGHRSMSFLKEQGLL